MLFEWPAAKLRELRKPTTNITEPRCFCPEEKECTEIWGATCFRPATEAKVAARRKQVRRIIKEWEN